MLPELYPRYQWVVFQSELNNRLSTRTVSDGMEFFIEVQQINVLWSSSRQCIHSDGSVTSF